mmetsp:Transcript_13836/g.18919  ORF Transcript_13836/g.18919 Transcript_13836/m.18919 type:complete len:153 (+) Transcript_13836:39-497(+)|eukprot:CAMPEP_0170085348 /NCGR_PEP_ID=MMETSP0019_2-20121128/20260_1 /TAXON_ID=98059 /ORGANISM="Dinobryon sp., Strain UTEXLB2267" /LENGTH=152 /DNA_ID=CAMNT_0010301777 /DNA_START=18 /DNA_END=476 /DNA_ORIENTATION=+
MPRHSSFQLYSDTNTKVVNETPAGSIGQNAGVANEGSKQKIVTEKIVNVMGSTAGAGSCEFHLYISARNREIFRMEDIERNKILEEETAAYEKKVEKNKREADERTAKNAEKRKRKREKEKAKASEMKALKLSAVDDASNSSKQPELSDEAT